MRYWLCCVVGLGRTNDSNHRDVPFRDSKLTKLLINSLGRCVVVLYTV